MFLWNPFYGNGIIDLITRTLLEEMQQYAISSQTEQQTLRFPRQNY